MIDRFLTRLKKKLLLKVTKNTREGKQRKKDTIFFQQEGQSIRSVCPWLHSRVSFSGIVSWCYLWLSSLLGGFIWLNIDCSSPRLGYNEYISIGRIVYPLRPRGPPPWIVFMGWYDADLNPNQLNADSITSFFSLIFFFFLKQIDLPAKILLHNLAKIVYFRNEGTIEIFEYLRTSRVFKLFFFFFLETPEWTFCKRKILALIFFFFTVFSRHVEDGYYGWEVCTRMTHTQT